jgi:hypothetical protein
MPELQSLDGTGYFLWFYVPNLGASLLFLAVFVVATGLHTWRMVKTRTWHCIPFVIGGIFELLGYALRAFAYNNTGKIMPYAFYSMATLLAPALFAATIYMSLGRLVRAIQAQPLLLIPERWITTLFVGGDILSFIVQGGGCGLMVMRNIDLVLMGEHIVVAGLVIQIVFLGLFGLTAGRLHRRLLQQRHSHVQLVVHDAYKLGLYILYSATALIMIRSIFRLVEFIQGREGFLLQTEWPTLVFDGAMMFATMVIYFIWHPCGYTMSSKRNQEMTSPEDPPRDPSVSFK